VSADLKNFLLFGGAHACAARCGVGERIVSRSESSEKFFESAKTAEPIPIATSLVELALVEFTLDPLVRRIEFLRTVCHRGHRVVLDAVVLGDDSGRTLVEFTDLAVPPDIDQAGLKLLAVDELNLAVRSVTAAEIRREPRATNARMVWACRGRRVHVDDRVRLLDLLDEEGPMSLSRAAVAMQFARGAIAAVLAMACSDLLEIEIDDAPLGPQTRVRLRRPAPPETE
jgi:hypothetical protein